MKPRTVRDLLLSLGISAGLGSAVPACSSTAAMITNPPPPDGSDTASGFGGTGGITNPPPPDANSAGHDGSDAAVGTGGSGGESGGVGGGDGGGLDRSIWNPPPDAHFGTDTATDGDDAD